VGLTVAVKHVGPLDFCSVLAGHQEGTPTLQQPHRCLCSARASCAEGTMKFSGSWESAMQDVSGLPLSL